MDSQKAVTNSQYIQLNY